MPPPRLFLLFSRSCAFFFLLRMRRRKTSGVPLFNGMKYCPQPLRSVGPTPLIHGVMKVADEAMQRLVTEDIDRRSVILIARRLDVDRAIVAPQARTCEPRSDQRLSKGFVARLHCIIGKHPGDRSVDRALCRDRIDRLGRRASRRCCDAENGYCTLKHPYGLHECQCRSAKLRRGEARQLLTMGRAARTRGGAL